MDREFCPDRRSVLRLGAGALIAVAATPALAARPAALSPRALSFRHLHTGEALQAVYWDGGRYVPDALAALDHLLRDHRTGESMPIDRTLFDTLARLSAVLDSDAPFEVISAYRSPRTNARLAARSGGVARRSLHMDGMAIDIRLSGTRLRHLRRAALALRAGGVGYYPRSGFVHVDTGRVRFW